VLLDNPGKQKSGYDWDLRQELLRKTLTEARIAPSGKKRGGKNTASLAKTLTAAPTVCRLKNGS
jgi:hypothetical protein